MEAFKNWVWYSSANSVKDKQSSVLAVGETICCCGLYWWFGIKWLLLVGAVVAPFLLMRSASSKELGRAWLQSYWWPTKTKWEEFRTSKKGMLVIVTMLAAGVITAAMMRILPDTSGLGFQACLGLIMGILGADLAWPTENKWHEVDSSKKKILARLIALTVGAIILLMIVKLPDSLHSDFRALSGGFIGILGASMVFLAIECELDFRGSSFRTFIEIFLLGICGAGVGAYLVADVYAGICAGSSALLLSATGFRALSARGRERPSGTKASPLAGTKGVGLAKMQRITPIIVLLAVPYMLAVFFRTVAIRVVATLRHLPEGIKAMPDNWAENSWRMDFCYPASILPEASEVSRHLTVQGLLQEYKKSTNLGEKTIYLFSGLVVYSIPANLYRWTLKSTVWAWWPLVLFLSPLFSDMSDDKRENRAKMTSTWAAKSVLILVAFYVLVYLIDRINVPMVRNLLGSLLSKEVTKGVGQVNTVINIPPLGLIWWGLLFGTAAVFVLFSYSNKINTLFRAELDARTLQLLSVENQKEFYRLTWLQEFWRRALMFAIIQACWWSSLYLLQQRIPDLMRVRIPEWIW